MDKTLRVNMKVEGSSSIVHMKVGETNSSVGMKINQPFYIISKGGENDYEKLINKPSIEGVILINDKTFEELGMIEADDLDIEIILQS